MPRIDENTVTAKKPFKKKSYRPWNLLDDDFSVVSNSPEKNISDERVITKESISNHLDTTKDSISSQIDTNLNDIVIKPASISNQISNHISNPFASPKTSEQQFLYTEFSPQEMIQRVAGLQRKILFHIVSDCILRSDLTSNPVTTDSLKVITNANTDTLKTAIQRLVNKNLLKRRKGKKGKGGFAIFTISEEIRNAVIDAQKKDFGNSQLVTNWISNKESISTYSSGSNLKTTTNNNINNFQDEKIIQNSPWDDLYIEPLSFIGFTKAHLNQIILDDKLTPEMVQDSIHAFTFDLEHNNKTKSLKSPPLNYFMGIMRSGSPYAPPSNYENPQDRAMRLYLERRKEQDQKKQAMEEELFNLAFKDWELEVSQDEKEKLLPEEIKNSRYSAEKTAFIRLYFKNEIWPNYKNKYRQDS